MPFGVARTDDQQKRNKAVCQACPQWDGKRKGCRFISECKRTRLMPALLARGSCRLNKWDQT
jgi:hypothetical protein